MPVGQLTNWHLLAPLAVGGLGSGLFIAPNAQFIVATVDRSDAGAASGVIGTVQRIGAAVGIGDAAASKQVYHGVFQQPDVAAHGEPAALQIDERVQNGLAGSVIGDLAAAIGAHHRDAVVHARQMLLTTGHADRVDRRMLELPQLVGRLRRARSGELAHGAPGGLVRREPQAADDHSTITTCGWSHRA